MTRHPDGSFTLYRPDGSPVLFNNQGERVEEKNIVITIEDSEEDEKVAEQDKCIVCLDRRANTLFMPCGHNIVCRSCLTEIEKTANRNTCIMCRAPIEEKLY